MKQKFLMLLAAVLLGSASAFAQSGNNEPLKGDVNGDGVVDVADIVAVIDVMAKGEADYFYFGTKQPTAANYTSLPGVVSTYTSMIEANGATVNVTAGQTIYLLCPASWVNRNPGELEDNNGNSINFSEEKDLATISGYAIFTAKALNTSKTISLKAYTYYLAQTVNDTITIADFNRTGYKPTTIECFDATGNDDLVTTLVYPESWGEPSSMISDSSGEECLDAWKQNMTHGDSEFLHIPDGYIGTYIRTFAESTFTVTWP